MKEFCNLSQINIEEVKARWTDITTKLLKYAPIEEKKSVKNALDQYYSIESNSEGTVCTLHMYIF